MNRSGGSGLPLPSLHLQFGGTPALVSNLWAGLVLAFRQLSKCQQSGRALHSRLRIVHLEVRYKIREKRCTDLVTSFDGSL
jgi:hypothetical protein